MDGNGRWAEKQGLPRSEGHLAGVEVVRTMVKACIEKHIRILSVWAFGSENWARPTMEVEFLMSLLLQSLQREVAELHANGVQVRFTGERKQLSQAIQAEILQAETLTMNNDKLCLNIVFNYGGKWDITQAAKAMAHQVVQGELQLDAINEHVFERFLTCHDLPNPDLFIRTSGEQRISNFFLWQLAYTELYFTDVHWPDFNRLELEKAIEYFSSRERRYGKTSQQLESQDV